MRKFNTLFIVVVLMSFNTAAHASVMYTITDLGNGQANAINASGQVVGEFPAGSRRNPTAFLYSNGSMQNLNTLDYNQSSCAYGINSSGQVVGQYANDAFLYSNGSMQDLGALGGSGSKASGINSSGQVVGWAITDHGQQHAFFYSSGGVMQDITPGVGSYSEAFGINDSGQVIVTQGSRLSATVYLNGLQQYGLWTGYGCAINNNGDVAGQNYYRHAALYSNGSQQDLGTYGYESTAYGINDNDQVVGTNGTNAFLYSEGSMQDLNSLIDPASGWTLQRANGINDSGQIVGYGIGPSGQQDAFLLTPVSVPEQATIGLLCIGFAMLLRKR